MPCRSRRATTLSPSAIMSSIDIWSSVSTDACQMTNSWKSARLTGSPLRRKSGSSKVSGPSSDWLLMASNKRRTRSLFSSVDMLLLLLLLTDPLPSCWSLALVNHATRAQPARPSYKPVKRKSNFAEFPFHELPRIPIPRTPVNSARTRGAHRRDVSHDIEVEANYRGPKWRRRYNALPNAPTDWSGWVLGENRIKNANGSIRVLLADDHTM